MNRTHKTICSAFTLFLFAALALSSALAQEEAGGSQAGGAVPAATGPAERNTENPPLSGLDTPISEPAYGGRSYLVPGIQLSEGVDSNPSATTAKFSNISTVTRALGSVDLQKIWRRYQLGLDYIAGGTIYAGARQSGVGRAYQVHTLAADQRMLWRTGQLVIRDMFDYLPEGTFGFNSYGGAGSFGSAFGGGVPGVGPGAGLGGGIAGGSPT
ncbi:MAG TPA: hypothetical protein VFB00_00630, partial [Terriglobales bacterium]|nr:hypothetical protein [Terriglobales bacterium]